MRSNRLLSREGAAALDLASRIRIETELTNAEGEAARLRAIPLGRGFDEYRSRSPWRRHLFNFLGPVTGRSVLDLGCGYNPTPVYLALAGARRVYACDVSPKAAAFVRSQAATCGVADRVFPVVCAAEQIPFADEKVDLIHGEAVLHHIDLSLAGPEIARVLARGGKAAFKDPLGHNPVLELARDYLPYGWRSKAKGTDRPLEFREIKKFGKTFSSCTYRGFGFLSTLVVAMWGRGDSKLRRFADKIDAIVLRCFPFLERYCRFVVTCLEK